MTSTPITTLPTDPAVRREYPFAVGIVMPGETVMQFIRFSNSGAADLFIDLLADPDTIATRWVTIADDTDSLAAVNDHPCWRMVSHFVR